MKHMRLGFDLRIYFNEHNNTIKLVQSKGNVTNRLSSFFVFGLGKRGNRCCVQTVAMLEEPTDSQELIYADHLYLIHLCN